MKTPAVNRLTLEDLGDALPDDVKRKLIEAINNGQTISYDTLSKNVNLLDNVGGQLISWRTTTQSWTWSALALVNGWQWFGSPYAVPAQRITDQARVLTKGLMKAGTNATFCTLPLGYRPLEQEGFTGAAFDGTNYVASRIDVKPDGTMTVTLGGAGIGVNCFVFLDQVQFDAVTPASMAVLPAQPSWPFVVKSRLRSKCLGVVPVSIVDQASPKSYLGPVSVDWEQLQDGSISIRHIPGLLPNRTYNVNLLALPS